MSKYYEHKTIGLMYKELVNSTFASYMRLIRWNNLVIIVITQLAIRHLVIAPILSTLNMSLQMSEGVFALLVLASVCIAGAGYVINDYFDIKTDSINKPSRPLVGKKISRRASIALHFWLNAAGVASGLYVAYVVHVFSFALIFPIAAGLLWFYSVSYKRQLLVGNILVAALTGIIPMLVLVFELPLLNKEYLPELLKLGLNFNVLVYWVGGFAFFAFILTLIREIVKDMEDFEGDAVVGRNSLPLAFGLESAKWVVILLSMFSVFALSYLFITRLMFLPDGEFDYFSLGYLSLFVLIPFLYMISRLFVAKVKADFTRISNLAKLIMLGGILYSVCFYFIVEYRILTL